MTSQDNSRYVTVEMFRAGIEEIKSEIRELRTEVRAIDRRAEINTVKIDELHYFMGIGFAIIAVVATLVGFVIALGPLFREMYKDKKQEKSESEKSEMLNTVQSMIDSAISQALSAKQ